LESSGVVAKLGEDGSGALSWRVFSPCVSEFSKGIIEIKFTNHQGPQRGHMKKNIFLTVFVALVLVFCSIQPVSAAATILYVDMEATGANDGASWENAYPLLQLALDQASTQPETLFEIWVAAGTYYPDQGPGHVDDSPEESFRILRNNVQLYGGFSGVETQRTQRDWSANVTTLSGGGNNAYHVLNLDGVTYRDIKGRTVIDGFTITAGNANGDGENGVGGGLYCAGSGSGHVCSPTLSNLIFSQNTANNKGAGMYNDGSDDGASSPILTDVTFDSNITNSFRAAGAGMYNDGSNNGTSSPQLFQVTFSNNAHNHSQSAGGGMYNDGSAGGVSSPYLEEVLLRITVA
jgi:hypothetical protein